MNLYFKKNGYNIVSHVQYSTSNAKFVHVNRELKQGVVLLNRGLQTEEPEEPPEPAEPIFFSKKKKPKKKWFLKTFNNKVKCVILIQHFFSYVK